MSDTQGESGRAISRVPGPSWAFAVTGSLNQRIRDMGLLPRLLIAEAVVLVILFAGGVLLISQLTNSLRDNIRQERLLLGRALAEDLDAALDHSITELQQLALGYELALARSDPAEIQGSLDLLAVESAMFTDCVLIVGPGGKVLEAGGCHSGLAQVDLRRYWPGLWSEGRGASEALTAAFRMEGEASPSVAIAVLVGGGSGGEYVVGLVDTVDSYPAGIVDRAVRLGRSGHADIVDRSGIALFSTESEHLLLTSDHPTCYHKLFREGKPVISECTRREVGASDGEPHLMAFVPLETLPWAISTGTTVSEAYATARQLWYGGLSFLVLLTGVVFVATIFASRRLVRPVKALSSSARSVAEGDRAVTIRIPSGGEIGELARSLETMRQSLNAAYQELAEANKRLESQVRERTARLEVVLRKVISVQEEERYRVARELHDETGQTLGALSIALDRARDGLHGVSPEALEQICTAKAISSSLLEETRRLILDLRPMVLDDLGLEPAIRWYMETHLEERGVAATVEVDQPAPRLPKHIEVSLFRVIQEAVNNIARHADARHAHIRLAFTGSTARVVIGDDGKGFDVDRVLGPGAVIESVGLLGMQERVRLLNGRIQVQSQEGKGTEVSVEIPIAEELA